jgi:hypothetical protein
MSGQISEELGSDIGGLQFKLTSSWSQLRLSVRHRVMALDSFRPIWRRIMNDFVEFGKVTEETQSGSEGTGDGGMFPQPLFAPLS